MRVLVITNRNVVEDSYGVQLFGNHLNQHALIEPNVAWAEKGQDGWQVHLITDRGDRSAEHATDTAIVEYLTALNTRGKHCAFYIHGFSTTFEESVDQAKMISDLYNIGVVVFSWPSSNGWSSSSYEEAKCMAHLSVPALDKTLEKFCSVLNDNFAERRDFSINLLIHSLGNYMFESYIHQPIFQDETDVFDNIVLNAPDVDYKGHRRWTGKLKCANQVYLVINEADDVLTYSRLPGYNFIHERLGRNSRIPRAKPKRLICFDISRGTGVGGSHQHFGDTSHVNDVVKRFFYRALHGETAFPCKGTKYDPWIRAHVLCKQEETEEQDDTE